MPQLKISQNTLPVLDGLSSDIVANLEVLELFTENRLRAILLETVPGQTQKQISRLLQIQQADALTEEKRQQLATLQKQADLIMLRKAYAATLVRFRGHQLPTLAELHQQT